jgi:hypothetical protein
MKRYTIIKSVRFDKLTAERMESNMQGSSITESEYIRQLIINDHADKRNFDKKQFIELRRVLAGCGNNLNQIAHKMNMDIYTPEDKDELRRCEGEIKEMRKNIDAIIKELF